MAGGTPSVFWPSVAVATSALFWGTAWYPLHRVGAAGLPPTWSGVLIFAVPALIVAPLIAWRWRAIRAGGWRLLAVGLAVGACNALFAVALSFGEVGMIVLPFYLNPIWATLMERLVLRIPITRMRVIGIALGLIGMVALQGLAGRWPFPEGSAEWMGLIAGACWAVALVASNLGSETAIMDKTSLQFVCAASIGLVLVLTMDPRGAWPTAEGIRAGLPWILATAGLWIVPAMGLSLWGAARMSPARASMLLMLEVLVALATAAWLNHEQIGINKLVGGALILSASLVEAWSSGGPESKSVAEGAAGKV
ncbi:MAG TPA: DMT family transporter [Candidatus Cybelea sp.]|nr:DMT family transporter [Candidatus Cybelea sp.]